MKLYSMWLPSLNILIDQVVPCVFLFFWISFAPIILKPRWPQNEGMRRRRRRRGGYGQ